MPRVRPTSIPTGYIWCKHCGAIIKASNKPRLNNDQISAIEALIEIGYKPMAIARKLNVPYQTAKYHYTKYVNLYNLRPSRR